MVLSKKQIDGIVRHAKDNYPQEVCGIIAGLNNTVKKIYKMKNVSDKPQVCYYMDPKEQFKIFKEIRKTKSELLGIYHSHTNSEAYPSARDVGMAYYPDAAYIIVSLKSLDKPEVKAYKIVDGKIENIIIKN